MKFEENSTQSAEFLRQAIPLMVKHKIPPNPLNYALWYTYVSKRIPNLNQQLDKILDTYGTCPLLMGEELFREFVIDDEIGKNDKVNSSLIELINGLHKHSDIATKSTMDYGSVLNDTLSALKEEQEPESLEQIINTLSENTDAISQSNQRFQQQIQSAQEEIEALKKELQESRQDARQDPLTGVFNRRVFDTELAQLCQLEGATASLVMIDVDHFKKFNDEYGHLMGDKVLQYIGKLLKDECTQPWLAVRYGGEEFAVITIGTPAPQAAEFAGQVLEKIRAIRIKQKKTGKIISSITASFGVAQLSADETPEALIQRADAALYQAKENGRNQVIIAD